MEEWTKEITLEMIPDACRCIAEEIGIEGFLKLTKVAGGITMYIPKKDTFLKQVRNMKIRQEYTGYNTKQLAIKYNVTTRWINEICEDKVMQGQSNLFETRE